ncbi:insulin-like growth factor-binding protein 2 [Petromyzon marinus]|uniref:Insulin-like growth factor-binding protein 2 n=1 Tax=Petromyzon marinus TaxID=7757 RepID=A0AAJ7SKZ8_PETMA|nr:insulin-like growth factor-binding protein 2 [Petromyzon marinus]
MALLAMRSCWALVALAALAAWRPGPGVRADGAFRCPTCTQERISRCPPAPPTSECVELVREPGCGCCSACALVEGAPCGVYTARCGFGLRCVPRGGTERPLHELIEGLGHCVRAGDAGGPTAEADTAGAERGDLGEHDEAEESHEVSAGVAHGWHGGRGRAPPAPQSPVVAAIAPPRTKPLQSAKADAVERSLHKAQENARFLGRPNGMKEDPFGIRPLNKKTPSQCQTELEQVLTRLGMLQLSDRDKSPEGLYPMRIPNCDRRGLYISKQCKPSLDGRRGECWCVDPYTGRQVTGSPVLRGDPDCQRFLTPTRAGRDDPPSGAAAKTKPPPTRPPPA